MNLEVGLRRRALGAALLVIVTTGAAKGQETLRASVDSAGAEGNARSERARLSGSGRFIAFSSAADDLVAGDVNGVDDVFVRDLVQQTTECASVDSTGVASNGDSAFPDLSKEGRFVAFESAATNLVAGDLNGEFDVFVHDRKSGATVRASVDAAGVEGNGRSGSASISSDARFVAFVSRADNLVPGDGNATQDAFVKDLATGAIERLSVDSGGAEANGWSGEVHLSGDGMLAVFISSATNLVAGDTNGCDDVFLRDRGTGTTTRVNLAWNGAQADDGAFLVAISRDGSTVGFASRATNLVANDSNANSDVFVVDLATLAIERVSVASDGSEGDQFSDRPRFSADGRYVAFGSFADNLVGGDGNADWDVFVRDRVAAVTWRASIDGSGVEGNSYSDVGDLDDSGRVVSFQSNASNLVANDLNAVEDVFVRVEAAAGWSNYGAGYAGTLGIPGFVASSDPLLGATFGVDLGNSLGADTFALIFVGLAKQSIATSAGGTLLVDMLLAYPVKVPAAGLHLDDAVPDDESLCGVPLFLQGLELDGGAAHGIAFTPGLEIRLGR